VTGNREAMDACFEYIKDILQPVPVYVREYEHNGMPVLVITPNRRKHAKLWLAAHLDVVPGKPEQFVPKHKGGKLYGRGAFDMKFAAACYVSLLTELGTSVADYDVGVVFTCDEEQGGHSGVRYFLETQKYTGDVAFLPDGTGCWQFEQSAKGKMLLQVVTHGEPAHGGKPWLGRSATHELMQVLDELRKAIDRMAKDDAEHWHATCHVGEIRGGEAPNMLAAHAEATMDVRCATKAEFTSFRKTVTRLRNKYRHTDIHVLNPDLPYGIPKSNGYAQTFARIAKERCGVDCGWARAHGASDARFFNKAGIPTILIAPKGGGSHGDKEWVDVRDLERYHDVLSEYVRTVAK